MNRYQRSDDHSYCLGMSLSVELLKKRPEKAKKVFLSDKVLRNEQLAFLLQMCKSHGIEVVYDERQIERLSAKENCYCIAVFDKYEMKLKGNDHIVLRGFSDPGDLGTIFRSAVSFAFTDIVLITDDIDLFDPQLIRASMGSFFHTDIRVYEDIAEYLNDYPGRQLCALNENAEKELRDLQLAEPFSLLIDSDEIDERLENADYYRIGHQGTKKISLPIRCSLLFSEAFHLKRSR